MRSKRSLGMNRRRRGKNSSTNCWPRRRYGERWGRYWLDLARYADTKGYVFQEDRNYAFSYTTAITSSAVFNEDRPYDRFVTEQLAADLLGLSNDDNALAPRWASSRSVAASSTPNKDLIDDRIDVVTRDFMGLTASRVRCHHDHKCDPIPTKRFTTALYGVFAEVQRAEGLPLIGEK